MDWPAGLRTAAAEGDGMKRLVILSLLLFCVVDLFSAERLSFDELYDFTVLGMDFSTKTRSLEGKTVQVDGFMAPPLKAKGNFLVLTKCPVSLCPYCNSDADWPADIIVVYLSKDEVFRQRNRTIRVTGRLETGSFTDRETGFVSQLRLVDASYQDV
jgi:hypothetical protein